MKRGRQLSFVDYKISSLIPPDDPLKLLFDSVDFSFIYPLLSKLYSKEGREGYDPVSLFKAILLIYLGFASSERDLSNKLRFDGRLSFLCGFSYGETPKHNIFHYFRKRLGSEIFSKILINLISQALCLIRYKTRSVIERFWQAFLKGSHFLEELRFRGIKNVSIHVIFSICAYLLRLIASMKMKTSLIAV